MAAGTRRRCAPTARRCCAVSMTTTAMPAPGRGQPFPLDRSRRQARARASQSDGAAPCSARRPTGPGCLRGSLGHTRREFNDIFAVCHRIGTGPWSPSMSLPARGPANCCRRRSAVSTRAQLITVIRKGTGEIQELPASSDAFVWLRLYQAEMEGVILAGRRQPLWWTLRRPVRPLTYHAAHRMFERASREPARLRRCIRCGIRLPTGWLRIRLFRSPTCSRCSATPGYDDPDLSDPT